MDLNPRRNVWAGVVAFGRRPDLGAGSSSGCLAFRNVPAQQGVVAGVVGWCRSRHAVLWACSKSSTTARGVRPWHTLPAGPKRTDYEQRAAADRTRYKKAMAAFSSYQQRKSRRQEAAKQAIERRRTKDKAARKKRVLAAVRAAEKAEDWVQCSRCELWVRLPAHVDVKRLGDDWVCEMARAWGSTSHDVIFEAWLRSWPLSNRRLLSSFFVSSVPSSRDALRTCERARGQSMAAALPCPGFHTTDSRLYALSVHATPDRRTGSLLRGAPRSPLNRKRCPPSRSVRRTKRRRPRGCTSTTPPTRSRCAR